MAAIKVSGKSIVQGLAVKLHYVRLVLDDGRLADGTRPTLLDQWAALGFYASILSEIRGAGDRDQYHLE